MSTIKQLQNKKIAILGLGIENYYLIKYLLKKKVKCEITICDRRSKKELGDKYNELNKIVETHCNVSLRWQLGKNYNKDLEKFDILFRSPGWPIKDTPLIKGVGGLKKGKNPPSPLYQGKAIISSPMKLFMELCPTKNIIGVTGTKGKGTTSSLIYAILKKSVETRHGASLQRRSRANVFLGGNIGIAPFAFLDQIKEKDFVVLELSSFQLEDMTKSPHIAVITNFYSEHLSPADPNNPNYHKSLKAYWEAKANIFKWQDKEDSVIFNKKLESRIKTRLQRELASGQDYELRSNKYSFSLNNEKSGIYWHNNEIKINKYKTIIHNSSFIIHTSLPGEHNKENIAAAVQVAKIIGIKDDIIKKAVAGFKGLEHRIELVTERKGVKYYDDSFATTPESTIIALRSFSAPIVLLAGGADKGASFKNLAKEVKKRVKFVILLDGKATPRIKKELLKTKFLATKMKIVYNIKDAISLARQNAQAGDIVLLSTACASFGMFKNYKQRGDLFKQEVNKIAR